MKQKNIKRGAHLATYLAAWWTLFSAFGIFDWLDAHRHIGSPDSFIPLTIWGIHIILITIAAYAWRKEIPQKILWLGNDDEILDVKPEEINIEFETIQFRKGILIEFAKLAGLIFYLKILNTFPSISNAFSSGLIYVPLLYTPYIIFRIVVYCIRYFVFRCKVKKWQKKARE